MSSSPPTIHPSTIPATFMRGGTSKALIFNAADLPKDKSKWDEIFCLAMGSPDPYGRQLNGMGGGISSLSKVCIVNKSSHPEADVDYTFGQVIVKENRVNYQNNCGNMSAAIGPYAIDHGLVNATGETTTVRIFNTNTKKIIHSTFPTPQGKSQYTGDFSIPGVFGTGAPIRLDFIEPGGATTGKLLPTGKVKDTLDIPGLGALEVSLIDAANATVFVRATDIGLTGLELPSEIDASQQITDMLQLIRQHASVKMGITTTLEEAKENISIPFIGFISPSQDNPTLSGEIVPKETLDFVVRVISNGQPHQALPLTVSLCTAIAAKLEGSLVSEMLDKEKRKKETLNLGMPSGFLSVAADVTQKNGEWFVKSGAFYRTARRLFEGQVWLS